MQKKGAKKIRALIDSVREGGGGYYCDTPLPKLLPGKKKKNKQLFTLEGNPQGEDEAAFCSTTMGGKKNRGKGVKKLKEMKRRSGKGNLGKQF